jgi:hypothetical protein
MICDVRKSKHQVELSYIRQVEAGFQYPRTMMYGFFAKRTDPPSSSLLFWLAAWLFLPSFLPSFLPAFACHLPRPTLVADGSVT